MAIRKFYSSKEKPGWKKEGQRFASWGFDIRLEDGRRKRESGFGTRALAEAAAARIKLGEKNKKYELEDKTEKFSPTFFELAQKRLPTIQNKRERVRSVTVLNMFIEMLPEDIKVVDLKKKHIIDFKEKRFADGLKASSVDREITIIAATLHDGENFFEDELGDWNCFKIPRPKVDKSRRERIIYRDEIERLLSELYKPKTDKEKESEFINRRRVGLIFHCCLLTGARKGEVEHLLKVSVDWIGGELLVRGSKTRHSQHQTVRYVPLTDTLRRVISEAEQINGGDYIFTLSGSPTKNHYKFMREACERAGIKYGRDITGGFVGHDARHTFISRSTQGGKDLASIGSITGHADKTLAMRYSHASVENRQGLMQIAEGYANWDFDKDLTIEESEKKPN